MKSMVKGQNCGWNSWSSEIYEKSELVLEVKFDTILLAFLRELDKIIFYL